MFTAVRICRSSPIDVMDRECGANGAFGIVLVRNRGAEDAIDRVADELLDRAAVALDLRPQARVIGRERRSHVLRVELLRPAVKPTRSVKSTVTTFRSSRAAGAAAVRAAPHMPHRRKPSGFSWAQTGQTCMALR